ncbi:MAG: YjgN family protein [Paracoccaceae bacterium]
MAVADLRTEYVGTRGSLFWLAFRSSILTVLTLGIYRFWMKTRLRRYYWSAIRPGGQPLEYVGEPLEKLLGFLIAVVFLAFYIGIVNLLLMFLSYSLLNDNFAAYATSLIGVVPILFYARFRARRYILARTRWRGVRFGMEPGAWGYAWRALAHWGVTILTLGLLWPRMTFWLEKYRTDLTYFGTQKFVQTGRWQMLYRAFLPLLTGVVVAAIGGVMIVVGNIAPGIPIVVLGGLIMAYGFVYYKVRSFRLLTNAKNLGGVGFVSRARTSRVLGIYILGYLVVGIFLVILMFVVLAIVAAVVQNAASDLEAFFISAPLWVQTMFGLLAYFSIFVLGGVFRQVFVVLPLARHYAETLEITGGVALPIISQRARDEFTEAEGFADALDVGAAF